LVVSVAVELVPFAEAAIPSLPAARPRAIAAAVGILASRLAVASVFVI
jgi:hypothetical protein